MGGLVIKQVISSKPKKRSGLSLTFYQEIFRVERRADTEPGGFSLNFEISSGYHMKRQLIISLIFIFVLLFHFQACYRTNTQEIHIVMLGDSITAQGDWPSLLKRNDVVNKGVSGDRTADVLRRLEEIFNLKPKWCLVMIGINDILSGQPVERIYENICKIIDGLKMHEIRPIIQSTLFLAGPDPQNEKVEALNQKLKNLAEERNILYLDLNSVLAPNKQLLTSFTHDGLHLNDAGYQVWKEEMARVGSNLLSLHLSQSIGAYLGSNTYSIRRYADSQTTYFSHWADWF
jgi:lysophospholipase L1-like esterase